jgi:hypothetical protein
MNADDRLRKLEARANYYDRQQRRMIDALKAAAGQLASIGPGATLADVIAAMRAAAGQIVGALKEKDQ